MRGQVTSSPSLGTAGEMASVDLPPPYPSMKYDWNADINEVYKRLGNNSPEEECANEPEPENGACQKPSKQS